MSSGYSCTSSNVPSVFVSDYTLIFNIGNKVARTSDVIALFLRFPKVDINVNIFTGCTLA